MKPFRAGPGTLETSEIPPAALVGEARLRTLRSLEHYRIEVSGDLTEARRNRLGDALEKALDVGAPRVVLDLRNVGVIDRDCVRTILMAHLRAGDQLQELLIVPGRDSVRAELDAISGPFLYAEA